MNSTLALALAAVLATESGGYHPSRAPTRDGGRAVGPYQVWPIAVDEANRIVGRRIWTLADRRDPQLSRAMCLATLRWHQDRGVVDPVALACRWRNPHGDAPAWHRERVARAVAAARRKGAP